MLSMEWTQNKQNKPTRLTPFRFKDLRRFFRSILRFLGELGLKLSKSQGIAKTNPNIPIEVNASRFNCIPRRWAKQTPLQASQTASAGYERVRPNSTDFGCERGVWDYEPANPPVSRLVLKGTI